jgi:hypothetical protein
LLDSWRYPKPLELQPTTLQRQGRQIYISLIKRGLHL